MIDYETHNQWCNPVVEVSQHEFTVTSVLRTNDFTFCCFTCLYVDFSQYLALLNGFYLPPARAWAPIVPFLADLFLELIESVQRSSALESKSLCVDGVGRSVTLNNRKTLQSIPSMTDSSPVPYVNNAAVNMSQSMGSIQLLACGPAILSNMSEQRRNL